jgi:hypothetical protein
MIKYNSLISLMPKAPGYDPNAQAFITAAGITDPTQQSAINQLVVDLKTYGIWTKMKALYPFVGGTASTHKWNLKDPQDTNAAYRLTFAGGWTHASTGALPNGTNAYADAYITNSAMSYTSTHLSVYSRTNNLDGISIGNTTNQYCLIYPRQTGDIFYSGINAPGFMTATVTDSTGHFLATRRGNTDSEAYRNGVSIATSTSAMANDNTTMYLGAAYRQSVGAIGYDDRELAFASIGDGLNDTEAANFYTAVQTFQTTLGRSIGTQTVSDADAQAFVTAASITDQVQATAINNLVIGMKADGLWTKMKAVYPFVGGTATSNSYNLKDTAQYQITWNGGVTHSSTGVTFNGTNGFGNTGLNDSTILNIDNKHISMYQRNVLVSFTGSSMGISNSNRFYLDFGGSNYSTLGMSQSPFAVQTPQRGMFVMSKTANGSFKYFQNALTPVTKTGTNNAQNLNYFVGASNNGGSGVDYTSANLAFVSLGDGLTDTEVTDLRTRVQAFQTTLNRQV